MCYVPLFPNKREYDPDEEKGKTCVEDQAHGSGDNWGADAAGGTGNRRTWREKWGVEAHHQRGENRLYYQPHRDVTWLTDQNISFLIDMIEIVTVTKAMTLRIFRPDKKRISNSVPALAVGHFRDLRH